MEINKPINSDTKDITEEKKTEEATGGSSNLFYILAGLSAVAFLISCIFFGLYVSTSSDRANQEMLMQREVERSNRIANITADQTLSKDRYSVLVDSEKKEHMLWKEKNANLNKTKDHLNKYIAEMNGTYGGGETLNSILMYALIGSGGLNIPGVIVDLLIKSSLTTTQNDYQAAVALNEDLSRKHIYIDKDIAGVRSLGNTAVQELLGLLTGGCWIDARVVYNSTVDGWTKANFRNKLADKTNILFYAVAGDVLLGGIVKAKWPAIAAGETFLEDAGARTFSSKSVGMCTVHTPKHAIKLDTPGALLEFGEGELQINENQSGKAAGGHDYTCPGTVNPHEFYYSGQRIPKFDFVIALQFFLINEAACQNPSPQEASV